MLPFALTVIVQQKKRLEHIKWTNNNFFLPMKLSKW